MAPLKHALVWIVAVGCASDPVYVRVTTIAEVAPQLRAAGRARVVTMDSDVKEQTIHPNDHVNLDGVDLTIAGLLKDCPDGPILQDDDTRHTYPKCLLATNNAVQLGVHRYVDRSKVAVGAMLAGFGGLVYCAIACDKPYRYISDGTLITIGVLSAVAIVVALRSLPRE